MLGKYHDKIPITCPDHGIFYQSLANHITCKAGCPGCRQEKRSLGHNKQTVDAWIHRSNTTHHNKYTYVIPECFSNADTDKIDIVCPEHGLFHQTLADHVRKKSGCPTCAKSSRIITNQQKYNRIHPAQRNISSINMSLLSDHTYLKYQHHGLNQTLEQIADSLGVQDTTVGRYFKKFSIPVTRFPASSGEKEVLTFVQSIINTPILVNDRSAIRPQELDVYIPEHNLAIEYCGLYWHSDRIKPDRYHKDKMDACADKNIRLITIFEDEWKTNPTLIQNKIAHILQRQPDKKVFARKCIIKPVTRVEKRQFFNDYHIQGDGPSSIQLGLYYNNQLTACMSFTTQQDGIFILTRYATSTHVVGGFTKLLSTFKVLFEWRKIESFADLRWSCGDLYDRSGFSKEYTIPPDYYWTNGIQRWHKFGFRHKHLPNKLSTYDSALTEAENCYNNGLYKIYDCGKIKYSITNSL